MKLKLIFLSFVFLCQASYAYAGETIVAVAANFSEPAKEIAEKFQQKTGNIATLSFGATGGFYTQIKNGAPFEVFLSADTARPQKLTEEGLAVQGTAFTYAIGQLVLWSSKSELVKDGSILNEAVIAHIAFCNPDAAPYGKASIETMHALKVYDQIKPKLVEGQNISQTFQFVKTGNAEIGFVALSQVINEKTGSQWIVPQTYYNPIRQDAVLLKTGENNDTAKAFLSFLKGPEAAKIIKDYGYVLVDAKK